MGSRSHTSKIFADANVHAVYVWKRCAGLQHGHRVHAPFDPFQESCWDERWSVSSFFGSVAGLSLVNTAFAQFAPSNTNAKSLGNLILQKLVYVACNCLILAVGLWKCKSMGLLPTGTGDWLAFESRGQVIFFSPFVSLSQLMKNRLLLFISHPRCRCFDHYLLFFGIRFQLDCCCSNSRVASHFKDTYASSEWQQPHHPELPTLIPNFDF
jgi:hypothetical protein